MSLNAPVNSVSSCRTSEITARRAKPHAEKHGVTLSPSPSTRMTRKWTFSGQVDGNRLDLISNPGKG
jgi:hypothetical protein